MLIFRARLISSRKEKLLHPPQFCTFAEEILIFSAPLNISFDSFISAARPSFAPFARLVFFQCRQIFGVFFLCHTYQRYMSIQRQNRVTLPPFLPSPLLSCRWTHPARKKINFQRREGKKEGWRDQKENGGRVSRGRKREREGGSWVGNRESLPRELERSAHGG